MDHSRLEEICILIFNKVCLDSISSRDIVATHRVSARSSSVLIMFVDPKDAEALLDSKHSIERLDKSEIDLEPSVKLFVDMRLTPFTWENWLFCAERQRDKTLYLKQKL